MKKVLLVAVALSSLLIGVSVQAQDDAIELQPGPNGSYVTDNTAKPVNGYYYWKWGDPETTGYCYETAPSGITVPPNNVINVSVGGTPGVDYQCYNQVPQ